jgi:trehalose 6-phosphate phosphatase
MTDRTENPPAARLAIAAEPSATAYFFDFDGTLVEIAEEPEAVVFAPRVARSLGLLLEAARGAVAIVSGRSIAQLDHHLAPLRIAAAGVHGLERRDHAGNVSLTPFDHEALQALAARTDAFAAASAGLLAEVKPGSVALHYRLDPAMEEACLAFAQAQAAANSAMRLVRGKMVVEMKLANRSKGDAVRAFMAESPFAGRVPLFAGDDVTDEAGFEAANALGGISLKVGEGPSVARHRLPNPSALADFMETLTGGRREQ